MTPTANLLSVVAACLLCIAAGHAADGGAKLDVAQLIADARGRYERAVRECEPELKRQVQEADAWYLARLAEMEPRFTKAGDPFALAAVQNERARMPDGWRRHGDEYLTRQGVLGQPYVTHEAWREKIQDWQTGILAKPAEEYLSTLLDLRLRLIKADDLSGAIAVEDAHREFAESQAKRSSNQPVSLTDPILNPPFNYCGTGRMRGTVARRGGFMEALRANPNSVFGIAIGRGLQWLTQNQAPDGSWGEADKPTVTGLALLCCLAADETNETPTCGLMVARAVEWLIENGTKNGGRLNMAPQFSPSGAEAHGICTYALCEYYAMTKDDRVLPIIRPAIAHIVAAQSARGGWSADFDKSGAKDELSISAWQIQALSAARNSAPDLPGAQLALDGAARFVASLQGPRGGYGSRERGDEYGLIGTGIDCLLQWPGNRGGFRKGVDRLLEGATDQQAVKYHAEHADIREWYHATRACLHFGGSAWIKWKHIVPKEIIRVQFPDGSWPIPAGKIPGLQSDPGKTGQVYRTALGLLSLETFLRYLPTATGY